MRARKILGTAALAALTLAGTVVVGSAPAGAATVSCGQAITASIVVDNNLTNCPGDGLVITASNIVVDLAGHVIDGSTTTNTSPNEYSGIRLTGVRNVTVRNGTVQEFDAGVVVGGGGNNTVMNLTVENNVNHATTTGTFNPCNFGDGITLFSSDGNRITNNRAIHNGPFSGISLVEDSDDNVVSGNQAVNQTVSNFHPNFIDLTPGPSGDPMNPEGLGPCGPFSQEPGGVGRLHQDIGIRIEGPGADRNRVEANSVSENQLYGITIHGYNCHPPAPRQPEANNGQNVISANSVQRNGFAGPDELGAGIGVLTQGPATMICVAFGNTVTANTSSFNAADGIFMGGRGSTGNNVSFNSVYGN
ncbi:MAG TPA: right-handed parallel beta-helix repeat-containing protein, partial [Acidimicrobiales bacterium]|nr:right-handed parallel beta-helix repeat-containing protein [Acidimicrobiales bacterium]